jgi:hypothetical protein
MSPLTKEQRIRGSDGAADWIILLSGYDADVVQNVAADWFSSLVLNLLGAQEKSIMGRYELSFAMTPHDLIAMQTS